MALFGGKTIPVARITPNGEFVVSMAELGALLAQAERDGFDAGYGWGEEYGANGRAVDFDSDFDDHCDTIKVTIDTSHEGDGDVFCQHSGVGLGKSTKAAENAHYRLSAAENMLRDRFALAALQADYMGDYSPVEIARLAYEIADLMMARRAA